ncbi:MAG TPA: aminotransferase class III-fold pyridoxal phosphate-dependent enzyme, partial [Gillisia sp.]|nr:aminotransferase class III-fold pyridoxal phosphate-dependent enzyme [Gillisia sp.]
VMGKGMGGGLPMGAFTASSEVMDNLMHDPELGHITTFGGNPVIAAAALATLQEITESDLMAVTHQKEQLIRKLLVHPLIKEIRGMGLMLAVMTESAEMATKIILKAQEKGLILFWLLFEKTAIRITPPLTITTQEIKEGCGIIIDILNEIESQS